MANLRYRTVDPSGGRKESQILCTGARILIWKSYISFTETITKYHLSSQGKQLNFLWLLVQQIKKFSIVISFKQKLKLISNLFFIRSSTIISQFLFP